MAHEKANLVCDDMCLVEGVSKEDFNTKITELNSAISELNTKITNCKLKGDFAILSGSMTAEANTESVTYVNYPTGFNSSNCVVLSSMTTKGGSFSSYYTYPYDVMGTNAEKGLRVYLHGDNVQISIDNNTETNRTFEYKVVLMKI